MARLTDIVRAIFSDGHTHTNDHGVRIHTSGSGQMSVVDFRELLASASVQRDLKTLSRIAAFHRANPGFRVPADAGVVGPVIQGPSRK